MAIKLESGFEIIEYSDLRYEKMTVEIQYSGEQIAQLNIDKGSAKAEIELFTKFTSLDFSPIFSMSDFIEALSQAQILLKGYDMPL